MLLSLVAIAFLVRALLLRHNHFLWSTAHEHLLIARRLADGSFHVSATDQHPLYGFLIFVIDRFVGDPIRVGGWISVIAGSLLPLPSFLLLRRFLSLPVALTAAALVAVHPWLARFSTEVLCESTFTLLFFTGLLMLAWARDRRRLWGFGLVGLAGGFAFLAKPEGALVILAAIAVIASGVSSHRKTDRAAVAAAVLLLIGFALVSGSYIARAGFSRKTVNLLGGFRELYPTQPPSPGMIDGGGPLDLRARYWADLGPMNEKVLFTEDERDNSFIVTMPLVRAVMAQPSKAIWIKLKEAGRFLKVCFRATTWPYALAFVLSCLFAVFGRRNADARWLLKLLFGVAAAYALIVVVFFAHIRFVIPIAALLCLLAAIGICWTTSAAWSRSRLAGAALAVVWATVIMVQSALVISLPFRASMNGYKEAGAWLSVHTEPGTRVLCAQPTTRVYANRQVLLHSRNLDETLRQMKSEKVDFLVVSDEVRKTVFNKSEDDLSKAGMRALARFDGALDGEEHPVTIYALREQIP